MSDPQDNGPLAPYEKHIRTHALLCSIGFLILLPVGVLIARLSRTFTKHWFKPHAAFQFIVAGPVIFAGWYYGHRCTAEFISGHYNDRHKKIGVALLVLYATQLAIGLVIHFFKTPSLFGGHRPPQNYFHALMGLAILALAAYQVHYGLKIEWPSSTGDLHPIPPSAIHAWIAVLVVFWVLYGLGLALLPRQYKQEMAQRRDTEKKVDETVVSKDAEVAAGDKTADVDNK